jgi:DNA polymerase-2
LADYNIQDCRLVLDIFDKTKLIDFAIARTRITGLPLDRIGGSVASFDFRYLPLLHRKGYVAPNGHLSDEIEHSPGGFVMNSQPGIYKNVAVLDFKSLYPSIIRSFKIDPLGLAIGLNQELDQSDMVPGYNGAWFSKTDSILPDLITDLWQLRDQAKENQDTALSQAIKIIMNSFYGVLGTGGCRFFDSRLASSITRRGHQIIQQTAVFIEQQGWPVIYGDTDSVFVWFKDIDDPDQASSYAKQLESQLNHWWHETLSKDYGIDSALEIEFETLYQRFLMPTVRGSDQGSKKRYAGVVWKNGKPQLVFKGLESVRTDWTRLARDFQSELYRRIFFDEPYRDFIKETVQQVMAGDLDGKLVYRKRLRRKIDDYQKNVPPHVQAARKAVAAGEKIRRGDWVEYVITINGSEPVNSQVSQVDYQHYIDKQLAPAADGILYFFQDSLAAITDQQMGLFG